MMPNRRSKRSVMGGTRVNVITVEAAHTAAQFPAWTA
jgi:hypothetical protein